MIHRLVNGRVKLISRHILHPLGRLIHEVKRRMKDAGLPDNLSAHSFRVAVATDLFAQGVDTKDVQYLLGHADPRTTRLYDRSEKKVTRNLVERIRIAI